MYDSPVFYLTITVHLLDQFIIVLRNSIGKYWCNFWTFVENWLKFSDICIQRSENALNFKMTSNSLQSLQLRSNHRATSLRFLCVECESHYSRTTVAIQSRETCKTVESQSRRSYDHCIAQTVILVLCRYRILTNINKFYKLNKIKLSLFTNFKLQVICSTAVRIQKFWCRTKISKIMWMTTVPKCKRR